MSDQQLPDGGAINKAINAVRGLRNPPGLTGRAAHIHYVTPPDDQQDLRSEVAGILQDMLQGALDHVSAACQPPPIVEEEMVMPEEMIDPTRLEAPQELQDPEELERVALEEKRREEFELALENYRLEEERKKEEERLRSLRARNRKRRI